MFAKFRCTKNAGNRPKMDEIGKFPRIMLIHVEWHQKKGFSLGFEDRPYLPLPPSDMNNLDYQI